MRARFFNTLLVSLSLFACSSLFAAPLVVNVAGIQSVGEFGDARNTVLDFQVGANSTITSLSFDVNLTAFTPSYLSEIGLAFSDSDLSIGVLFTPGLGDALPGTASYSGFADLVALGLSFEVGSDGILRLEFFEDWDDAIGVNGLWNYGTLTFGIETVGGEVPEPATVLLMATGLALLAHANRRRRAA